MQGHRMIELAHALAAVKIRQDVPAEGHATAGDIAYKIAQVQ